METLEALGRVETGKASGGRTGAAAPRPAGVESRRASPALAPAPVRPRGVPVRSRGGEGVGVPTRLRRATPADAPRVVEIYERLYRGTYPYEEMLDAAELARMLANDDVLFFALELDGSGGNAPGDSGRVIGGFTAVREREQRRGYWRGLVLEERYHGKVGITGVARRMVAASKAAFPRVQVWYGETRTAHAKTQHVFEKLGYDPYAFLPAKDSFFGRRESDVLMYSALTPELAATRAGNVALLPSVAPLYRVVNWRGHLPDDPPVVDPHDVERRAPPAPPRLLAAARAGTALLDGWLGRATLACRLGADHLHLDVTRAVANAEHARFSYSSPERLDAMVAAAVDACDAAGLAYAEVHASAAKPVEQLVLERRGFVPVGYAPAFRRVARPGSTEPAAAPCGDHRREDVVVYARLRGVDRLPPARLTPRASALLAAARARLEATQVERPPAAPSC
ncbi:MAG: hypothetical protein Kow0069_37650 [Promethearchaeota archaeon]